MTTKQTALTIMRLADPLPDELRPTAEAEARAADVVTVPYELATARSIHAAPDPRAKTLALSAVSLAAIAVAALIGLAGVLSTTGSAPNRPAVSNAVSNSIPPSEPSGPLASRAQSNAEVALCQARVSYLLTAMLDAYNQVRAAGQSIAQANQAALSKLSELADTHGSQYNRLRSAWNQHHNDVNAGHLQVSAVATEVC